MEFTSARSAAMIVTGGCHQLIARHLVNTSLARALGVP